MGFPRWLEPLPHAQLMRDTDQWAIQSRGIPGAELMERAGAGLARAIGEQAPTGRIAIACGKGNNGGDGLVAARLLRNAGRDVDVLSLWPLDRLGDDALEQLGRLPGEPPLPFGPERLEGAQLIVDALLGTGTTGAPRTPVAEAIEAINVAAAPALAADVPSGVDASTGEVAGVAIEAAATVTFHAAKPGLRISPGKWHAGRVRVVDIGIPDGAPGEPEIGLIGPGVLKTMPRRGSRSSKFDSGVVFVIGGSPGLTGAPCLAAMAAMRAGAGYVTIGAPASLSDIAGNAPLEVMTVALEDEGGHLSGRALEQTLRAVARAHAVVLGPGIGRSPGTLGLVGELAERTDIPLVLDADGLQAFANGGLSLLTRRRYPTVLTPHTGEMARLLASSRDVVERERLASARAAAKRARAFVVLKGDDSLICSPDGRTAVSPGDAPALATAGTGDVLSGVIAAMLAKRLPPAHAASAAVWVHARAGRIAAREHGPDGVIATDVIAALPEALSQ